MINNCCGKHPDVCEVDEESKSGFDRIMCRTCNRTIWGVDDESIQEWNNGLSDEPLDKESKGE